MIEEAGYDSFSLRELAARLGVKPASLYNHLDGVEEITAAVALKAARELGAALRAATEGKEPDEAFFDGALAYRSFATEKPELYKAFIRTPLLSDGKAKEAGRLSFAPMRKIIRSYGLSQTDFVRFHRSFRSVMHGFIELTNNGFMTFGNEEQDVSYEHIIRKYLEDLKEYRERNGEEKK